MRDALRSIISLVVAALGVGCAVVEVPTIRVGYAPHDHHAPVFIAAALSISGDGVDGIRMEELEPRTRYALYQNERKRAYVELFPSVGAAQLVRRLEERHFDLILGGVPAIIAAIDRGSAMRLVAPVNAEGAALVMNTEQQLDTWDAFVQYAHAAQRPIRIGYREDVSVQNIIFERALVAEGIQFAYGIEVLDAGGERVRMVNVYGAANLLPALEAGVIEGFVAAQPYPTIAHMHGLGRIVSTLEHLPPTGWWTEHPCCAMAVVDPETIERLRELLSVFVALVRAAAGFINSYPERSAPLVAAWLDSDQTVEGLTLPTIRFLSNYTAEWRRGTERLVELMVDAGFLDGVVKEAWQSGLLDAAIYDNRLMEPVEAVAPR